MTALHLVRVVGKVADFEVTQRLSIKVTILDVREVWGRTDYLITPTAGSGEQWICADRIKVS